MDGCIYRTKDGECYLYAEGGKFTAFCDPEHCDNIAPTNADRIRAMSDEELADMLNHAQGDGYLVGIGQRKVSAYGNWLDWLREEAKDG